MVGSRNSSSSSASEPIIYTHPDEKLNAEDFVEAEVLEGATHQINYRNCSWEKTAGLLFSEYICLAIMSFPWSYSVLGLVPGLILTVFVAITVFYTGLTITDYCVAYPHLIDVADIGQHLFFGSRWAYYATSVCFLLNNLLIQALHVLVGAKYLNTISDNTTICSVAFSVVTMIICFLISLPRTFSSLSIVAYFSAATMFVAVVLSVVFAAIQDHPGGYDKLQLPVTYSLWPKKGTTFVDGMSAFLNIVYTFVGQVIYPSFISQMKRPKDFKKAIYAVTILQVITFALAGSIVYVYVGNEYITAPAFGSLLTVYKKIAFSFAVPTIFFLGSLYGNVSAQFLFLKFFDSKSRHRNNHTVKGWTTWIGILLVSWILAFVVAEVIPFFSDLLSLMSSLFDCWFGFVFWGVAYFKLRKSNYNKRGEEGVSMLRIFSEATVWGKTEYIINIFLIGMGLYILGPGLYAAIDSIVLSYQSHLYGNPFTCTSNGI